MRKNNAKQGFRELQAQLKMIADERMSPAEKFNESITAINAFLKMVREQVLATTFHDKLEEVYFFKFEKPEYVSVKLYQEALFALQNQRPADAPDLLRTYYLEELRFIARFFKQHAFHYEYFRSGFTELDELLFLRRDSVQSVLIPELPDIDPHFSTNGDFLFAKFMAYELLQEYIVGQLKMLDVRDMPVASRVVGQRRLDWTGEVINLVELGYGLYLSRQIGGGKAGLQEIFNWLEESFGLEIGIPANRFRDIKRRKRLSRTHFLDLVREGLIRYMDEEFE